MEEHEKIQAVLNLLSELSKGEQSGNEKGWIAIGDAEKELGVLSG